MDNNAIPNYPSGLYYTYSRKVHRAYYSNARLSSIVSFYFNSEEMAREFIKAHSHLMDLPSHEVLPILMLSAPMSLTELRK